MAKKKSSKKAKTKRKTKAKNRSQRRVAKSKRRTAKPKTAKRAAPQAKPSAAPVAPAARVSTLPDIDVQTTGGGRLKLSSLRGKNVVLYFYPKDDTPGCTTEGCDIRDHYGEFQRLDTVVLGVSRDDLNSHERFKSKFNFPFELVSDTDEKLCRAFDVIREKSNYGKTYMGIDRSTFLFDKSGALRKEMRGVSVPGHIDQILEEVKRF
jgi:thioredoxin-dependent peroxiredoxin